MTFHHVRLVHGSALNTSGAAAPAAPDEVAAADAWPLMGVADFDDSIVGWSTGAEYRAARDPVPVRLPLPPARSPGLDLREPVDVDAQLLPESHALALVCSLTSPLPVPPERVGTAIETPRPRSAEIAHTPAVPMDSSGSHSTRWPRALRASPVAAPMGCSRSSRPG